MLAAFGKKLNQWTIYSSYATLQGHAGIKYIGVSYSRHVHTIQAIIAIKDKLVSLKKIKDKLGVSFAMGIIMLMT
jgi:hypothetical protein